MDLKKILDENYLQFSTEKNLFDFADPLQIAKTLKDERAILICALFAYGNAKLILKFLKSLDFELLNLSESVIKKELKNFKYRFENSEDIAQIFITLRRFGLENNIQDLLLDGLNKGEIFIGIKNLIDKIYQINDYRSFGYEFFFGKTFENIPKSPFKRYNMFLRWMVRDTDIDLGFFTKISKSSLLLPLDTHTHKVSLKLGLTNRKIYDFKAVLDITQKLRNFDPKDPIKYDFALYRLGQSGKIDEIL